MPYHYRLKHILALDGSVILCYCVRNWQIKCESGREPGNMTRRSLTFSEAESPRVSKRPGGRWPAKRTPYIAGRPDRASFEVRTFAFL